MHLVVERLPMVPPSIAPLTAQEEALRVKRGGGLHPARPDWRLPTKRPRATPGGLIAAIVISRM